MSTTHEAGWAHAPGALRGPAWLQPPGDPNALVPHLWSSTAHKNADGELTVGGLAVPDARRGGQHPGVRPRRGGLPGPGPRLPRRASPTTTSSTPARRSCAPTVAQWVAEEGLNLDVCSAGELTVALKAGFDPARIGYHGNNKTHAELRRAVVEGVGRIVLDSFVEIERLAQITAEDSAPDRSR